MRDKFWTLYVDLVQSRYYYEHYQHHAVRVDRAIQIFTSITSASSIASWFVWNQLNWLWAFLIALSQLVNVIYRFLPYPKQIESVNYILPDIKKLMNSVDYYWGLIETNCPSENEINKKIFDYKNQYQCLEQKYINDSVFPPKGSVTKKADTDRVKYFYERYGIDDKICMKGNENNESCKSILKSS